MFDPFHEHGDEWIAYGDFITTLLGIFLICTVLLIPFINPESKSNNGLINPGSMVVEAVWHEDDVDVDLWARAPNDPSVGYSNTRGKIFNLLRDDLGYAFEKVGGIHYENVFSRGTPAGEYVINLHLYRDMPRKFPIHVEVGVSITNENKGDPIVIAKVGVDLTRENEEITVVRFRLDANGAVVPGSLNNLYQPLRTPAGSQGGGL